MQSTPDFSPTNGALWPTYALQQSLQQWMALQQIQLQTLYAWQQAMVTIQQDWFDRWSCQYAGAARIDD